MTANRRTTSEVLEALYTAFYSSPFEDRAISALAHEIQSNTKVIKRWMELLQVAQYLPKILSSDATHYRIEDSPAAVYFQSEQRQHILSSNFRTYNSSLFPSFELYNVMFNLTESVADADIIIIDNQDIPRLDSGIYLSRKIIFTTTPTGLPPLPLWRLFILYKAFQDYTYKPQNVLQLSTDDLARAIIADTFPSRESRLAVAYLFQQSIFPIHVFPPHPPEFSDITEYEDQYLEYSRMLANTIYLSEYTAEDANFWMALNENTIAQLVTNDFGIILLSRLRFFASATQDLYIASSIPAEAKLWMHLNRVRSSIIPTATEQPLISHTELTGHPLGLQLLTQYYGLTSADFMSFAAEYHSTTSVWFFQLEQITTCLLNSSLLFEEKWGRLMKIERYMQPNVFPFLHHWVVNTLEISFKQAQISPQGAHSAYLLHYTARTFGTSDLFIDKQVEIILRSILLESVDGLSIPIANLLSLNSADRYPLLREDLTLIIVLFQLNIEQSIISQISYPICELIKLLQPNQIINCESSDLPQTKGKPIFVRLLRGIIRRYIDDALLAFKGKHVGKLKRLFTSDYWPKSVKIHLSLILIALPEFHQFTESIENNELRGLLSQLAMGQNNLPADLLLLRLFLQEHFSNLPKSVPTEHIQRILTSSYTSEDTNAFLISHISQCKNEISKLKHEIPWVKKLKIKEISVREKLVRVPFSSARAKNMIYQRFIPRQGRKPKNKQKLFTDVALNLPIIKIYQILLIRAFMLADLKKVRLEE